MTSDAVIFDFDGVFVDSYSLVWQAYNNMCAAFGFKQFATIEDFGKFYTVNYLKNYNELGLYGDDAKKASSMVDRFMLDNYHLAPFFEDMVSVASSLKIPIGIASSAIDPAIRKKIKGTLLESKVKCIIGADTTGIENIKPSPLSLIMCAQGLGVELWNTAYVGDTTVDIEAGRNAMAGKVIAVSWGFDDEKKLKAANPDVLIHKPEDLLREI